MPYVVAHAGQDPLLAGATLTVRLNRGAGATLYTDYTGATSTGASTVVASGTGAFTFYAPPDVVYTVHHAQYGARFSIMVPSGGAALPGQSIQVVRGRYDFAVDGGVVGDIDLSKTAVIPPSAVILGGFVEVDTALTSGGSATVAVKVEGAADIVAAAAFGGAPWSTTGRKSVIPAFTGVTVVKTTATRKILATIATAALTAGAFDVVLFSVQMPD